MRSWGILNNTAVLHRRVLLLLFFLLFYGGHALAKAELGPSAFDLSVRTYPRKTASVQTFQGSNAPKLASRTLTLSPLVLLCLWWALPLLKAAAGVILRPCGDLNGSKPGVHGSLSLSLKTWNKQCNNIMRTCKKPGETSASWYIIGSTNGPLLSQLLSLLLLQLLQQYETKLVWRMYESTIKWPK